MLTSPGSCSHVPAVRRRLGECAYQWGHAVGAPDQGPLDGRGVVEGEEGDVGLRVVAPSLVGDRAHHVPYHDQGKDLVEGRDGRSAADGASGRCAGWQDRALRLTEFALPTAQCGPFGIAAGPDGALWFAETAADRIGRITTDGSVTEYPLPDRSPSPPTPTARSPSTTCPPRPPNRTGSRWARTAPCGRPWRQAHSPASHPPPGTPDRGTPHEIRTRGLRDGRVTRPDPGRPPRLAHRVPEVDRRARGSGQTRGRRRPRHRAPGPRHRAQNVGRVRGRDRDRDRGTVHSGEETVGGWFVLEVADHAEAIELARGFPTPEALEIRPLLESA